MNIKTRFCIGDEVYPKDKGQSAKTAISGIIVEVNEPGIIIKYRLDSNLFVTYGETALSPIENKEESSKEVQL